jgi:hypothetical protein
MGEADALLVLESAGELKHLPVYPHDAAVAIAFQVGEAHQCSAYKTPPKAASQSKTIPAANLKFPVR